MSGPDRGNGVLIALHGHGDEPRSARAWGRGIAAPGWEVLAPGAPRGDDGARSWFSTGPRGVSERDLDAAVQRVGDLVDRIRRGGRPVVVAGFSQGGAVALSLPAYGVAPDAIVAMCTFLPEIDGETAAPALRVPVLVLGAEDDEDVPSFLGEDAAAHLAAQGLVVASAVLVGGHEVSATLQRHAADWLHHARRRGPRVSLGLPVDRVEHGPELVSGAAVAELARGYERHGFDALYVTDHPAPDDRWLAGGGHHALDPAAVLSAAAIATARIRLHTNVFVLPYRNPFLAAKSLASVDVLSGGRLIAGVAAGYLRPEFDSLGSTFDERGALLDEALELLPQIWAGTSVERGGRSWSSRGTTSLPRPVQRPHPPIWVGGNSTTAMRRAVRHGQGWSPFPTPAGAGRGLKTAEIVDVEALSARLVALREMCEEQGRTEPLEVCFVPFSLAGYLDDPVGGLGPLVEEVAALAALGVDWVALSVPGSTRSEVLERSESLADSLALR